MNEVCAQCGKPIEVTLERGIHNHIKIPACLDCLRAGWNWKAFINRNKKNGGKEALGKQIDVID